MTIGGTTLDIKTEEAAEQALAEEERLLGSRICPVLHTTCQQSMCVCYLPGRVVKVDQGRKLTFNVYKPDCQNPLISGEITIYQYQ